MPAPKPIFAHDANLGFQVDDALWSGFLERHGIEVAPYRDMAKLTRDLKAEPVSFAYLPAANYFYLREQGAYQPLASAVYAASGSSSFASLLVVAAGSDIAILDELRGRKLGYAHRYCTSSYFAPAILLHEHSLDIDDLFAQLVEVPPYEGQIDAVMSGRVDATMVEEDVWRKDEANARDTRVIGRRDGLPTPLLIVAKEASQTLADELSELALSHRPETTAETLFAGFVPYERKRVEGFYGLAEHGLARVLERHTDSRYSASAAPSAGRRRA